MFSDRLSCLFCPTQSSVSLFTSRGVCLRVCASPGVPGVKVLVVVPQGFPGTLPLGGCEAGVPQRACHSMSPPCPGMFAASTQHSAALFLSPTNISPQFNFHIHPLFPAPTISFLFFHLHLPPPSFPASFITFCPSRSDSCSLPFVCSFNGCSS